MGRFRRLLLKLHITIIILTMITVPILAVNDSMNDSMNTDDIVNVKPSIPFGGHLFSQIFAAVKWGAVACFFIGFFGTLASGFLGTMADNAQWSENAQNKLFTILKILLLGGFVFIAGIYIFETHL